MSNNVRFAKAFDCGAGGVVPNTIVKAGAADYQVVQAAAATDKLLGVTLEVGANAAQRVDVALLGIVDCKLGGTVARGDLLTSDGSGNAVTAAPSVGSNNRVIGIALMSGVAGDIIPVYLQPSTIQG